MKNSEVYLRAAQLCDENPKPLSCCAIAHAAAAYGTLAWSQAYNSLAVKTYSHIFKDELTHGPFWLHNSSLPKNAYNAWRVTALLFMHQIALDEERKARKK